LLGPPGQRFSYSSPGYVLLAWIVERAADQSYASFELDTVGMGAGDVWSTVGDLAR